MEAQLFAYATEKSACAEERRPAQTTRTHNEAGKGVAGQAQPGRDDRPGATRTVSSAGTIAAGRQVES